MSSESLNYIFLLSDPNPTNISISFKPKNLVYGGNVTITAQGKVPVDIKKFQNGAWWSMTLWNDNFPDPIYKTTRHRPHECPKIMKRPNLGNLVYHISKDYLFSDWALVVCPLEPGQYVNMSAEMVFVIREYGQGKYRSVALPGSFFSNGMYRVLWRFFDDFDEEFLCLDAKGYVKWQ